MDSTTIVPYVAVALASCASAISFVLLSGKHRQVDSFQIRRRGGPWSVGKFSAKSVQWIITMLVLAPALTAQINQQPDTQTGDFIYKMPDGWKQVPNGALVTLVAPSAAPGTATTIVLGTYGMVTDLQTSFTRAWDVVQKQYHAQQVGNVVSQRLPGGNDAMAVSATTTDGSGRQWAALFLLVGNGNRSEMVLFVTDDLQQQSYATSMNALAAFLASLRFTPAGLGPGGVPGYANLLGNAGGALSPSGSVAQSVASYPVPMAVGPGRLAGIYRATAWDGGASADALDIFDSAKKTPDYAFLTFFPDGRVKKGLIGGGFDGYQDESTFRHDVANGGNIAAKWGIYQIYGGGGRIVFADARLAGQQLIYGLRGETWNFIRGPASLQIQGVTYSLLDSGNGMKLEGIYKPSGDAAQPGIQFTRDGQFVDEGILDSHTGMAIGMVGGGVGIGYGFSSPHAGHGTYRISDYGLQLHYANGQAPNALLFIEPGSSRDNPDVLYINNVKYQRVR